MSGKNWNGERRTSVLPLNPAIAIQASGNMTVTAISAIRTPEAIRRGTLRVMSDSLSVDGFVGADQPEDDDRDRAEHHEQQQRGGQREARGVRGEVAEAVEDVQVR